MSPGLRPMLCRRAQQKGPVRITPPGPDWFPPCRVEDPIGTPAHATSDTRFRRRSWEPERVTTPLLRPN